MKRPVRLTAALLLAALCVGLFPACSETTVEDDPAVEAAPESPEIVEPAAEEEEDPDILHDNLPDTDFGGFNFRILSTVFVGRELATFLVTDEMNGEAVNDAVFVSAESVADRFNITFETVSVTDITAVRDTARSSIKAGSDDFDIQCGQDTYTAGLAKEGLFFNLFDVEQYDFSQPWWPKNIVDKLEVAGKLYIGSNYLTYNGLHWTRVLIANKDRFEETGLEIPYDTIISGNWYLDTMKELLAGAERDLDGDGEIGNRDLYSFMMGGGSTYCVQDCADLKFYTKEEESLTLALDLERVTTFVDKWLAFFDSPGAFFDDGSNEFCSKAFLENRLVMGTTMIGTAYDEFRDTDIRYCLLTYPKLDELQESYINTCTDAFWAIPITAYDQLEIVGTVTEALSCANFQNVLPIYYETAIKVKLSESPDDAAMFDIIRDGRTIGFEYAYGTMLSNVFSTFVQNETNVASYLKRYEKSIQKEADKLVKEFLSHES